MGGIAGIICSNPIAEETIGPIVDKMLKSIIHRGPDDKGIAYIPYGGIGYQRLGIVDIRSGHQPFYHPDKPYVLVLNGEIYNYRVLQRKLEEKGIVFHTRCDAEVLMMMYDYYDEDMFQYLEGMYAFALWNGDKKELIIARDPLGKKPLYYEMDDFGIAFASELKAILQARNSKPHINEIALEHYLALQYVPSPMTMFEGIFKLPPGYMLRWRIEDKSLEIWPIWIPDDEVSKFLVQNNNLSLEDAMGEFDQQLRHAVQTRVNSSDVPVGVFLNGKLDGTIVATLAKQHVDYPLQTYSVRYTGLTTTEKGTTSPIQIAKAIGTNHTEIELGPECLDQLPRILWHLDEPIADPQALVVDAWARKAAESLKVVLTGHGAEEIFGADAKYRFYSLLMKLRQIPSFAGKALSMGLDPILFAALGWEKSQLIQAALNQHDPLTIWQTYRNFPERERKQLLKSHKAFPDRRFRAFSKGIFNPYVQLQWDDLHHLLPHDILLGLDKMTMAHSIEARSPFLDPQLVAWTMGLPDRLKWQGFENQYVMREYAKKLLPRTLVKARCSSANFPLNAWLADRKDTMVFNLYNSALVQETDLLSQPYISKLLQLYDTGMLRTCQPIWNLLVLKIWYDVFTRCSSKGDLWELQKSGSTF